MVIFHLYVSANISHVDQQQRQKKGNQRGDEPHHKEFFYFRLFEYILWTQLGYTNTQNGRNIDLNQ